MFFPDRDKTGYGSGIFKVCGTHAVFVSWDLAPPPASFSSSVAHQYLPEGYFWQ